MDDGFGSRKRRRHSKRSRITNDFSQCALFHSSRLMFRSVVMRLATDRKTIQHVITFSTLSNTATTSSSRTGLISGLADVFFYPLQSLTEYVSFLSCECTVDVWDRMQWVPDLPLTTVAMLIKQLLTINQVERGMMHAIGN